MTEHNYLVAWCLEDVDYAEGYGNYQDCYERFTGKDAYEDALAEYNRVLKLDNLHTASFTLELKSTD